MTDLWIFFHLVERVSSVAVLADHLMFSLFPIRKEIGYVFRPNPQQRNSRVVGEKNREAKTNGT